ncbi:MAG: hypothetical protein H7318_04705 [Oligoflexus sp.]|nr:hypothetical protein [Oligoflexus sp.]
MATELERIAAKARLDASLRFTSLAHHITPQLLRKHLDKMHGNTASGVDQQTKVEAKATIGEWGPEILDAMHRCGYKAPAVRRVQIPKPGKSEKRPIGIPTVSDRALQGAVSEVLSTIYEQDLRTGFFSPAHMVVAPNEVPTKRSASCSTRSPAVKSTGYLSAT